jgi:flagellar biosynthesis/type III secretory pathway protein FliH
MLKAKLIPPSLTVEVMVDAVRTTVEETKARAAASMASTRRKCAMYARATRRRAYTAGYRAGLAAATEECTAAIRAITSTYEKAAQLARDDAALLAKELAARIIGHTLRADSEMLRAWIEDATRPLGGSRPLTLSYTPHYAKLIAHLKGHLPANITTVRATELGEVDFLISGETGGVECSWRRALEEE